MTKISTNFTKFLVNNLKNDSFWHHAQSIPNLSIRKNTSSWKWRWFRPISPNFWLIIWKIGHFETMPNRLHFFQFAKLHHRENDQFFDQFQQNNLKKWVILTASSNNSISKPPRIECHNLNYNNSSALLPRIITMIKDRSAPYGDTNHNNYDNNNNRNK